MRQMVLWAAGVAVVAAFLVVVVSASELSPKKGYIAVSREWKRTSCKEELGRVLRDALNYGTISGRPSECSGLTSDEIAQLAGEVLAEEVTR